MDFMSVKREDVRCCVCSKELVPLDDGRYYPVYNGSFYCMLCYLDMRINGDFQ